MPSVSMHMPIGTVESNLSVPTMPNKSSGEMHTACAKTNSLSGLIVVRMPVTKGI